eukprot:12918733-Heterocapsa_arctica.AAC.1
MLQPDISIGSASSRSSSSQRSRSDHGDQVRFLGATVATTASIRAAIFCPQAGRQATKGYECNARELRQEG